METDSDEKQLLNQILNAVKVTPSLNEDLQVEVMKVGLTWEELPFYCDYVIVSCRPLDWDRWLSSWLWSCKLTLIV